MGIGAATLLASSLFQQGLGLVTLAVVARILSPADLGVAAYFLIAAAFIDLMQRQIPLALVRLDEVTADHLGTVFTLQVLAGLSLSALSLALIPLAGMTGLAPVVSLLPTVAVYAILSAFRSPRFQLFERDLSFAYGAAEDSLGRAVYSITAIVLVWLLRDHWALVWAMFAGQAAKIVWTFSMAPMRPRLTLSLWRESVSFTSWALAATTIDFLSLRLPQLVIGMALGLREAGLLRLGSNFIDLVTYQLAAPMMRVLYPGLAEATRDDRDPREVFMRSNEMFLAVLLPFAVGLALIAEDAIRYGLGEQWVPAAQVIWVLAPLQSLMVLQANVRAAAYVANETRILFLRSLVQLPVMAGLLYLGAQNGFHGMIAAVAAFNLTSLSITLFLGRRYGTGGMLAPLLRGWRSFLSCAAMALAVLGVEALPGLTADLPRLAVQVLTGMVVYPMVLLALWRLAGRPEGAEAFLLKLAGRALGRLRRT